MPAQQRKILRDYHNIKSASSTLAFFKQVAAALSNKSVFPDEFWGGKLSLLEEYLATVAQFEVEYHVALNGGKLEIATRNKTGELAADQLDALAAYLQSECINKPEKLLFSGFNLTKVERKSGGKREPLQAARDFQVYNLPEQGKAKGSAGPLKGAFNHEIHSCRINPSIESNWAHKGIFMDISDMVMEGLEPGDIFFRMRSYGPDGPGPWSGIVSTTIT